jgi:hypothetical protein
MKKMSWIRSMAFQVFKWDLGYCMHRLSDRTTANLYLSKEAMLNPNKISKLLMVNS